MLEPPPGFPNGSNMKYLCFEAKDELCFSSNHCHEELTFFDRLATSFKKSEALCFRACTYLSSQYENKPVLSVGPVLPDPSFAPVLEKRWDYVGILSEHLLYGVVSSTWRSCKHQSLTRQLKVDVDVDVDVDVERREEDG
ncbi:hypothetical protein FRX31_009195 [Thalictrum thalictroides]|uniref:Uncharacterized protein n=1 Tax=Thalictrum thalictroides TaxID=46969 RepID=A0A7J6WWC5_THATH|nr:hypothetical protein FRX31_009195 [Thalictrum thalictroides]